MYIGWHYAVFECKFLNDYIFSMALFKDRHFICKQVVVDVYCKLHRILVYTYVHMHGHILYSIKGQHNVGMF